MPLDFYREDKNEYLFGLTDNQFEALFEIFEQFRYKTGLAIDQYSDSKLSVENQEAIIQIIDKYILTSDLNKDKSKTLTIIEFRTYLKHFSQSKVALSLKGD